MSSREREREREIINGLGEWVGLRRARPVDLELHLAYSADCSQPPSRPTVIQWESLRRTVQSVLAVRCAYALRTVHVASLCGDGGDDIKKS